MQYIIVIMMAEFLQSPNRIYVLFFILHVHRYVRQRRIIQRNAINDDITMGVATNMPLLLIIMKILLLVKTYFSDYRKLGKEKNHLVRPNTLLRLLLGYR